MQLKGFLPIVAGCLFLTTSAQGQPDGSDVLAENTAKMKVTITMDRDVYLQGELYTADIEVMNPTNQSLLVEEPFGGQCVSMAKKEGDKTVSVTSRPGYEPFCNSTRELAITLGPGERRSSVLGPFGFNDSGGWPQLMGGHGMWLEPGEYILTYAYGAGAQAEFRIVHPKLEASTVARVKDEMYSDRPDQQDPHPIPAFIQVMAFRWKDQSYICVDQSPITNLERPPGLKPGEPYADAFDFKRVATSQEPIVELSAAADPEENLRIEWKTASGRRDSFYYAASYVVRDVHERARKRMLEEHNKDNEDN